MVSSPIVHRHVAVFVDMWSAFGRDLLSGVGRYAQSAASWTIYGDPERVVAPINDVAQWRGGGIIAQVWREDIRQLMDRVSVPVVNVSQHMAGSTAANVLADSDQIGRMVAKYFLERGFRHFGFCGFAGHRYSELRADAYISQLQEHGFDVSRFDTEPPQVEPTRWQERMSELGSWVRQLPRPIGVMCCNDVRARHVAQACVDVAVRVPEELAIVGTDDDHLICEISTPPLSSVDINALQIGYEAAALLDRMMAGTASPPPRPVLIPPIGIVTRRSSDVLAITDPTVAQAVRFIYDHAREPIGVDDVVAAVPASRRVLERRFKASLGTTMGDQISAVRIARAKQLLVESDIPTPLIAERSGFNYVQQFNTTFKRLTGMTPMAYRRQYRVR